MIDILELKNNCSSLHVLYVEDNIELHESVLRYLRKIFKKVDNVYDGQEGLSKYQASKYDIVLTDIKMPKLDGIKMADAIRKINSDQEIIILSAYAESNYFLEAIHLNISDYILKPIDYDQMNRVLLKVAKRVQILKENLKYHQNLEKEVMDKTKLLTDNYEKTLTAMVEMIENRDSYTGGHSERVANYCKLIAQEMNLSEEECNLIFRAGMLHDIGKVTTPDILLLKPGKLSEREFYLIKSHVTASYQLLSKIPMYVEIAEIILPHHEKYDGSGYPNGLQGDEIPLLSRIMIIADAFDAMTTDRIYKGRKMVEEAIEEIEKCSGTQFDPAIVPYATNVLSRVTLDNVSQLPKNTLEQERFSYFFRDVLTDTYNHEYLHMYLRECIDKAHCQSTMYCLQNFTQYNKKFGWSAGDELLKSFAQYLRNNHPDAMIFRIHGDDFILISETPIVNDSEDCVQPSFLDDTGVSVGCNHFNNVSDIIADIRYVKGS
jgi:putative nucleotidyltransferase with HDIG domain